MKPCANKSYVWWLVIYYQIDLDYFNFRIINCFFSFFFYKCAYLHTRHVRVERGEWKDMTKVAKFVSNENKKLKNSLPTHLFVITTIACWCISQPAPYMMNKWTVKGRASAHFKASNAFTWIGLETPEINFSSKIVNFKAPHNQIFSTIELHCLFISCHNIRFFRIFYLFILDQRIKKNLAFSAS